MFTITLTLRGTEHQPVLAFESLRSLMIARDYYLDMTPGKSLGCHDDYGQIVYVMPADIIAMSVADVELHWKYRNCVSIIKLRAENNFNAALEKDPTLRFHLGQSNPHFGGRG